MKTIFLDFDGTLINSQNRLYNLFAELCPENNLSYEEYWNIKRNRLSQKELLQKYFSYSNERCCVFKKKWLEKIEENKRTETDFPLTDATPFLNEISKNNLLYLITNRQNKNIVEQQIKKFNWSDYFTKLLVTEGKISKSEMIKKYLSHKQKNLLISDTGEDILEAQKLHIISIAVNWGILHENILKEYFPDFIANSFADLKEIINNC